MRLHELGWRAGLGWAGLGWAEGWAPDQKMWVSGVKQVVRDEKSHSEHRQPGLRGRAVLSDAVFAAIT